MPQPTSARPILSRLFVVFVLLLSVAGLLRPILAQDLKVTKSAPANATAGDSLTYSLTVENIGSAAASGVSLSDTLPIGTTFQSLTQTSGPAFSVSKPAVGQRGTVSLSRSALQGAVRNSFAGRTVFSFTQVGNTMFFVVGDANIGKELWKTDGTATGTVKIKTFTNIPPSTTYPWFPPSILAVNNTLYFAADDGASGMELWKSDGTSNGTTIVKDISPGTTGSNPSSFVNVNGTLFFSADDSRTGKEIWKSNGSMSGTALIKDINIGSSSSFIGNPVVVNGNLFFIAYDGPIGDGHGVQIWKSNGTANGTSVVSNLQGGRDPRWLAVSGGTLFFSGSDDERGSGLWKSDGTTLGTVIVKDTVPNSFCSTPLFTLNANGTLYFFTSGSSNFSANDRDTLAEIWKSNGTTTGTVRIKTISSLKENASPTFPYYSGNKVFFQVSGSVTGNELWQSDGTANGTHIVKDIYPGESDSAIFYSVDLNGSLFFTAVDGVSGRELWTTNGTNSGTYRVRDLNPGAANGVSYLAVYNNSLLFPGNDGSGIELWTSDGTASGTVPLRSSGEVATFNLTVKIDSNFSGPLSNTASASSSSGDANPNNNSATATTQVKALAPPNNAPVLSDATFNATQNTPFSQQLAGNDADGDALTYRVIVGTLPNGLILSTSGLLSGTPTVVGVKVVTVEVADGKDGTGAARITFDVKDGNRAPTLSPTLSPSIALTDSVLTVVPSGDDADGDALTYSYSWKKNGVIINGATTASLDLSIVGNGDKGDVIVSTVSVSDGKGGSATASVQITVTNSAPVATANSFSIVQGQSVSGQLGGTDADGDALSFIAATNPMNGTLSLSGRSFSYASNANFVGEDSFTFTVSDGQSSSAPVVVTITIAQGNRPPTLADATFDAKVGDGFSQQLAGTDADGDALIYRVTEGALSDGLTLSPQGLLAGTPTKAGMAVVTVEVDDGKSGIERAQITINVTAQPQPPTLDPTIAPALPKTNDTITVAANAVDPAGGALTYNYDFRINGKSVQNGASNTLDLSKPGQGNKNDVILCEVTATTASGTKATAPAQVTVQNSQPIAISSQGEVPADTLKGFALNFYDADGDAVTYKRVGGPRNGVTADIRVDPTDGKTKLFYRSRPFYGGVDIIRFVVFDSSNKQSNESTLGINVLYTPPPPANRAPIAGDTNIDTYVGKSEVKGLLGSDPDGDAITFRIVGNAKYGSSEIKRDTDGAFKLFYTSLNRFYGADSVTYVVKDSRGKESNLATVNINFINRSPVALGNRIQVASGETVSQFLFADDPDNDAVTYRLVNNPRYGRGEVKLDSEGKWRFFYTSLPGYVGPDQITFIAIDSFGKESQVAAIDINVVRVGSTPAGALRSGGEAPSGGGS